MRIVNSQVRNVTYDVGSARDSGDALMKLFRKEFWFETRSRRSYSNITPHVDASLAVSGISDGICVVIAMSPTSSVFIIDEDLGLRKDIERWLERLAPYEPVAQYRHNDEGDDDADAYLKRALMGREVTLAVTAGKLELGPNEQVFYGEFNGRRRKPVILKLLGE